MHLCVLAETEPIRFDTDSDSKPVAKGGRPSMFIPTRAGVCPKVPFARCRLRDGSRLKGSLEFSPTRQLAL